MQTVGPVLPVCGGLQKVAQSPSNAGNVSPVDRLDLELKDHEGSTALWLALQYITLASDASVNPFEDDAPVVNGTSFKENSFAAQLIQRGSNADAPDAATGAGAAAGCVGCGSVPSDSTVMLTGAVGSSAGHCLMQRAALAGGEAAALFLATHGAKVNHVSRWVRWKMRVSRAVLMGRVGLALLGPQMAMNLASEVVLMESFARIQGESPLHTACRCGLAGLTAELLQQGANPNLQTQKPLPEDASGVAMQSPLHMAIAHNHPDVVSVILEQKGQLLSVFYARVVKSVRHLLTVSSVDALQPMLFTPPTTSRSFQTSV